MKGLSPLDKLNQGFSYVENEQHQAVTRVGQVNEGNCLYVIASNLQPSNVSSAGSPARGRASA